MTQLPAGTIEVGENPEDAAEREVLEETGVHAEVTAFVRIRHERWETEDRRRWIYILVAPAGLPDEWPFTCDCGAPIRCYWLSAQDAGAHIVEPQRSWIEAAAPFLNTVITTDPQRAAATELVRLESVTNENWRSVAAVKVNDDQKGFLDSESVLDFLMEAQFYPDFKPHAIYFGDTVVGMISFGFLDGDHLRAWIPLIVIDRPYQGRGFGRAAMEAVITRVRREAPNCKAIGVSYKHGNIAAATLYRRLGFTAAATADDKGNYEAWLDLT
jgi:diamine N-acetyltransferase